MLDLERKPLTEKLFSTTKTRKEPRVKNCCLQAKVKISNSYRNLKLGKQWDTGHESIPAFLY